MNYNTNLKLSFNTSKLTRLNTLFASTQHLCLLFYSFTNICGLYKTGHCTVADSQNFLTNWHHCP